MCGCITACGGDAVSYYNEPERQRNWRAGCSIGGRTVTLDKYCGVVMACQALVIDLPRKYEHVNMHSVGHVIPVVAPSVVLQ